MKCENTCQFQLMSGLWSGEAAALAGPNRGRRAARAAAVQRSADPLTADETGSFADRENSQFPSIPDTCTASVYT